MKYLYSCEYLPYQPAFERKPSYQNRKLEPTDPLYDLIWEYYQFDLSNTDNRELWVIPDACIDTIFVYTPSNMKMMVTGSASSFVNMDIDGEINVIFGVRFRTGACGTLFNSNACEVAATMVDGMVSLYDPFTIHRQMSCAETFEERIQLVHQYFLNCKNNRYELPVIIDYSVNKIIDQWGVISVNELANETGYSQRYLRKMFDTYVGVSPKLLCEIVKFQRSFHLFQVHNDYQLSTIATECGYYDQAHMNKAYKKLASNLPKKLDKIL